MQHFENSNFYNLALQFYSKDGVLLFNEESLVVVIIFDLFLYSSILLNLDVLV